MFCPKMVLFKLKFFIRSILGNLPTYFWISGLVFILLVFSYQKWTKWLRNLPKEHHWIPFYTYFLLQSHLVNEHFYDSLVNLIFLIENRLLIIIIANFGKDMSHRWFFFLFYNILICFFSFFSVFRTLLQKFACPSVSKSGTQKVEPTWNALLWSISSKHDNFSTSFLIKSTNIMFVFPVKRNNISIF